MLFEEDLSGKSKSKSKSNSIANDWFSFARCWCTGNVDVCGFASIESAPFDGQDTKQDWIEVLGGEAVLMLSCTVATASPDEHGVVGPIGAVTPITGGGGLGDTR